MRVLMVTSFPTNSDQIVGGVAGVSACLVRQLNLQDGLNVEVLSTHSQHREGFTIDFHGTPAHFLPLHEHGSRPHLARVVADYATAGGYDLVHVQSATEWTRFITQPLVFTAHGIRERDFLFRRYPFFRWLAQTALRLREQRLRRRLRNVIAISPYVLAAVGRSFGGNIWDIENPVRNEFFDLPRRPLPGQFLYAGVLTPRKNIITLIRAFRTVRDRLPEARLWIAGEATVPRYFRKCRRLVSSLGMDESVDFLGTLKINELQKRLVKSQALVLCSFQETAPLVIGEAMAAGVPVVASNRCGMPFMVEHGKSGFLVEPRSTAVAQAMLRIVESDSVDDLSRRCREIARERFDASIVASRTADVYREVLGQSTPG